MLTTAKSAAFGVWNRYRLVCKVLNKSLFCLRWRNLENNQLPTHQSTQTRGSKLHVWQCMKTEMLKTRDDENARGPYWSASRLYILVNILKFKPSAGCHKSICFKREKRKIITLQFQASMLGHQFVAFLTRFTRTRCRVCETDTCLHFWKFPP